jgi:hypothetical protein
MRLTLGNSNQSAVPYETAVPGFWQTGDTTWPGLGTVACVLASRHVADNVIRCMPKGRALHRKFLLERVMHKT